MKRSLLVTLAAACAAALPAAALADVPLGAGKVVVKKYPGGVTVHAFMTQDAMNDVASLIETRRGLVAVEAPAFRSDIAAWKGYIRSLRKPVRAVLLSNHPSNGGWYGNAPVYSTASAKAMFRTAPGRRQTKIVFASFDASSVLSATMPMASRDSSSGIAPFRGRDPRNEMPS